jgi:AcrR family transcriptional regulator
MARRNDHTKEEIREMVIRAGSDLIKSSGFSGFSTRQIAKEIGYTVGTLYNVFESYDDIVLHINASTLDDMRKFIEEGLNSKLKNAKAVKQLAKLYIDFAHKNHNSWSALFEYNVPSELDLPEWYNQRIENLFSIVEGLLSEFISKKSEALKHAKVIWASIHGICVLSLTQKLNVAGTESVEVLTDSLIENYLRGLEK